MIGLIAGWLVNRSIAKGGAMTVPHARRLAKAGLVVAGGVLLVTGWLVFDHFNDRAAIREHEAERTEDALEGERRATANDQERTAARNADSEAAQDDLDEIHTSDPESAAQPASPGFRRVAERLPQGE